MGDKLSTSHVNHVAPKDCKHTDISTTLQHIDALNSTGCYSLLSDIYVNTVSELQQLTLCRPSANLSILQQLEQPYLGGGGDNLQVLFRLCNTFQHSRLLVLPHFAYKAFLVLLEFFFAC